MAFRIMAIVGQRGTRQIPPMRPAMLVLLGTALAACSAPPPEVKPAAKSALLTLVEKTADEICACPDVACVEQATLHGKEALQLPIDARHPVDLARLEAAKQRGRACAAKLSAAKTVPAAVNPAVTAYQALADEVCKCADLACLEQASKHGDEVMAANADAHGSAADVAAIKAAGDRLQACTTRFMNRKSK
jgi:hypothetical protein